MQTLTKNWLGMSKLNEAINLDRSCNTTISISHSVINKLSEHV